MLGHAFGTAKQLDQWGNLIRDTVSVILAHNRCLINLFDARVRSGWETYRCGIQRHQATIDMVEGGLDRILYLTTFHSNDHEYWRSSSTWREILYGLLSLNRLAMDCASSGTLDRSFGATLSTTQSPPHVPVTAIRMALTVTHCIMPSLLGILPLRDPMSRSRSQAKVRLLLERIKCYLRLWLLVSYWFQSVREQQGNGDDICHKIPRIGILRKGGIYEDIENEGPTLKQQKAMEVRQLYIGARTGRRVSPTMLLPTSSLTASSQFGRVVIAEVLHATRPLYWASAEAGNFAGEIRRNDIHALSHYKPWLLTLFMDLTSLWLTSHLHNNGNPVTREEWNRRRMKLFFYMLRTPVYNSVTSPIADKVFGVVERFPVLGSVMESYMREWLLYWKHPFSSEES